MKTGKDFHKEFMGMFNDLSSSFKLEKYSKELIPKGKVLQSKPSETIWEALGKIEDNDYLDLGNGRYVERIYLFKKPTRILFLTLLSEFEERLYRAIEYEQLDKAGLDDKNINDLIRIFFEKDLLKLQDKYDSRSAFKEDLKAISSFRNLLAHTNKKLEDSMDWELIMKRKQQIMKSLIALQQITDKLKIKLLAKAKDVY